MTQAKSWKVFLGAARLALLTTLFALPASALETKVFDLPPNTYVHNVAQAPDGKLWLTAPRQNALGVLDPTTGEVRFIPLGKNSAAITVVVGKDGNAYITDLGQKAIVRVNVKTDEVKLFPVPQDGGGVSLMYAVFDRDGILWFTGRGPTDAYGRLDVTTGEMRVWRPTQGRASQGITVTPDNEVWYVSVVGSYIARIDRATGEPKIVPTSQPNVEPHGIWSDSKGNLWVDQWNSGTLNRYSPKTGKWTGWRLPGGKPPHGFGVFVDDKDIIWIVQKSGNTVYAFDPKTETFTAEISGSKPQADVRLITGRPGEVWLPEAGVSRLMVVKTGAAKAAARTASSAANISTQKVVFKTGDWWVRRTPDGMTGKKGCTGLHRDDYQVQLIEDGLFVSQAKNGGLSKYSVRFDDGPTSEERTASTQEDLMAGVTLVGEDFSKALASRRLRLHFSTAAGRVTDEDIDITGIRAAHEAIIRGKDCL